MDFSTFKFTGQEITRMMRVGRKTIKQLSCEMGISQKRIREVRAEGISGHAACDWCEAITGELTPRMRAAYIHINH